MSSELISQEFPAGVQYHVAVHSMDLLLLILLTSYKSALIQRLACCKAVSGPSLAHFSLFFAYLEPGYCGSLSD